VNYPVTLTTSIGRSVADLPPNRPPEEAVRFIDSISTMIGCRNEDACDAAILADLAGLRSTNSRDLAPRR
jgi:hypothetical protein